MDAMEQKTQKECAHPDKHRINMMTAYPDVLDAEQVSAILGVSTKTVYRLLQDGSITALKVGRSYRIPKVHLLSYLKVNTNLHI